MKFVDLLTRTMQQLQALWVTMKSSVLPYAVLGFMLVLGFTIAHYQLRYRFGVLARAPVQELTLADQTRDTSLAALNRRCAPCGTLAAYMTMAQHYKMHHFETARLYFQAYYASACIVAIGSILVAVTILVIAKKGWDGAPTWLKTTALAASLVATSCTALIQVLDMKDNSSSNLALYFDFDRMQLDMFDHLHVVDPVDSASVADLRKYTSEMGKRIQENRKIFLSIEVSSMPEPIWKTTEPAGMQ